MNLELNETQLLLQETVHGYLESEVPYERIRNLEKSGDWDRQLWKELVSQGWLGLPFSESVGGADGSLVDLGLLVEELARRAAIVPILECVVTGRALQSSEADGQILTDLLAGDAIVVPALPGPHDVLESGAAGLSGHIGFVDFGHKATHHLVSTREGLVLVEVPQAGVSCEALHHIGRTPAAAVQYASAQGLRVGDNALAETMLQSARALAGVQCVGALQQSLDMTIEYAKVREQFGKPIGSFQAVRHHCADMAIRARSARLLVFEALDGLDRGSADARQVAAAKASASRSAVEVTLMAHQIHGGNGVIEENDLYFTTLRAKDRALAWGTVDECLGVMAESVDQEVDWL
ncbi:MAG: hypothetical protein CL908_03350 [Deltaproteobacteria bacterium]|nr:hypothetical protein [Deltaproteobacteria bacterium]